MLHRRDAMIRLGQLGLGALSLPSFLAARPASAAGSRGRRTAKSCIYIFLWGGPPQQDLWDMKPDAPLGIRSLFQPMRTVVPGIDICDQMPLLAKHTDKVAIVRSVAHASNVHEASVYHMLTGRQNPTLVSPRKSHFIDAPKTRRPREDSFVLARPSRRLRLRLALNGADISECGRPAL